MYPVFFAWLGTYEDLVGLGFHSSGNRARAVAIVHGSAYIGVIEAPSAGVRTHLSDLSPDLVVLPGPNSALGDVHAKHLAKVAPAMKAKQGDPMRAVLSFVHGLYGHGEFDPDAY